MLTRDLLRFSVRKGRIRPRFVDRDDPALAALAEDLAGYAREAPGRPKREVDEAMSARALAHDDPKMARGLVKLLQDRMEVADPGEQALERRERVFAAAMEALAAVEEDGELAAYEAAIAERIGEPLDGVRAALYEDLPDARLVEAVDPIDGPGLLDRYNLALAQGLVMYAGRLELSLPGLGRPEVRRVLRWLRFCRLVAEVRAEADGGTALGVEGPAALFDGGKGYGLQLAQFLAVVPSVGTWSLSAEVRLPRRPTATLALTGADPLVSSFGGGAGYVPAELGAILEGIELGGWTIDPAPAPRTVGPTGLAVPDFALIPEAGAPRVVELFHRWHRGQLTRRLDELAACPDPSFWVGVDKSLLSDADLAARIEGHPRCFTFRGFPSSRAVRRIARS